MLRRLDLIPLNEKRIFSCVCIVLVIFHMIFPKTIDWVSIALMCLALAPWIIHLVKEIELPGGTKIGLIEQTTVANPPSASQLPSSIPIDDLLSDAKIIKTLKTLWKYQQEYYSNDPINRWAFKVTPPAVEFADYLESVLKLYRAGYVTLSPEGAFCMLTNEGISFCKQNGDSLKINNASEIYRF
jgi:hypothetical protein